MVRFIWFLTERSGILGWMESTLKRFRIKATFNKPSQSWVRLICGTTDGGTAETVEPVEPMEPKEMTVLITTAFS